MRPSARALAALSFTALVAASPAAFAFGGSAPELAKPGTFVISNRANVGFTHVFNDNSSTVDFDPELDFMVVTGLSVGGAVLVHYDTGSKRVAAGVVPQIGYDVTISDSWSFWPRFAITLVANGQFQSSAELTAPFLIHPAEHFFFGFGPGIQLGIAGAPKLDVLLGTFLVCGYFDH